MSSNPPNKDNKSSAEGTTNNHSSTSANPEPLRSNEIVLTATCHPCYADLSKRHASFATWPNRNLPSVDDLIRAGFFYTGTGIVVTCFYCNGSLENWHPDDNPLVEHTRWFPSCAYAKKLREDDIYRKSQAAKRTSQGLFEHNKISGQIFCFFRTCQN
jgi:hypothetical protein